MIARFVCTLQNYVRNNWEQSGGFCKFYMYIFSFHDLFVPLVLILESCSDTLGHQRSPIKIFCCLFMT